MKMANLARIELRLVSDRKYLLFYALLLFISTGFPFYGIATYLGGELFRSGTPMAVKAQILDLLGDSLLLRFSMTIYLIAAWGFIPRAFFTSKAEGEVETLLAMGFSGRAVWAAKALAVVLISLVLSWPLLLLLVGALHWYAAAFVGGTIHWRAISILFAFLFNPLCGAGLVFLMGGLQLLADDIRRSALGVFLLGVLNMGIMFGGGNTFSRSLMLVYGVLGVVLLVANIFLASRLTSENIALSTIAGTRRASGGRTQRFSVLS